MVFLEFTVSATPPPHSCAAAASFAPVFALLLPSESCKPIRGTTAPTTLPFFFSRVANPVAAHSVATLNPHPPSRVSASCCIQSRSPSRCLSQRHHRRAPAARAASTPLLSPLIPPRLARPGCFHRHSSRRHRGTSSTNSHHAQPPLRAPSATTQPLQFVFGIFES